MQSSICTDLDIFKKQFDPTIEYIPPPTPEVPVLLQFLI
jgi:hypothetical protein